MPTSNEEAPLAVVVVLEFDAPDEGELDAGLELLELEPDDAPPVGPPTAEVMMPEAAEVGEVTMTVVPFVPVVDDTTAFEPPR